LNFQTFNENFFIFIQLLKLRGLDVQWTPGEPGALTI
jgi:hypothetical protein